MKTNFIIYFQILNFFLFFSCKNDSASTVLTKNSHELPSELREVSGMTYVNGKLWAIQDNGNTTELFQLSDEGKILKKIKLEFVKNHDWEAITHDNDGNLYIGDFGNNDNLRKNLAIYKINKADLNKNSIGKLETIFFNYGDQKDFPPKKKELFYDCESFFYKNGFFYLFTKNRSKNFDGTSYVYLIANKPEKQTISLQTTFITCDKYNSGAITDAALSPDGKTFVLLSNKRMWIYPDFKDAKSVKSVNKKIKFATYTQRESVTFKNNNTLFISDEKTKNVGGNLYEYDLK
jgi:hypothetical protein